MPNQTPQADQLIQWIDKGCTDAIQKQYLQTLLFGIYLDEKFPENFVEIYTFHFSYPDKHLFSVALQKNNGPNTKFDFTRDEVTRDTCGLLRHLLVLTQSLEPLPEQAFLTMKLFYYDHVTPEDYEPPLFKPCLDAPIILAGGDPMEIDVGSVTSSYHALSLKVHATEKPLERQTVRAINLFGEEDDQVQLLTSENIIQPVTASTYAVSSIAKGIDKMGLSKSVSQKPVASARKKPSAAPKRSRNTKSSSKASSRSKPPLPPPPKASKNTNKIVVQQPLSHKPHKPVESTEASGRDDHLPQQDAKRNSEHVEQNTQELIDALKSGEKTSTSSESADHDYYDDDVCHDEKTLMNTEEAQNLFASTQPLSPKNNDANVLPVAAIVPSKQDEVLKEDLLMDTAHRLTRERMSRLLSTKSSSFRLMGTTEPVQISDKLTSGISSSVKLIKEETDAGNSGIILGCPCQSTDKESHLIQCRVCHVSYHAVCIGYRPESSTPIPTEYSCHRCVEPNISAEDLKMIQDIALFRRALYITYQVDIVNSIKSYQRMIGVTYTMSKLAMSWLKKEGVLIPEPFTKKSPFSSSSHAFRVVKTHQTRELYLRCYPNSAYDDDNFVNDEIVDETQNTQGIATPAELVVEPTQINEQLNLSNKRKEVCDDSLAAPSVEQKDDALARIIKKRKVSIVTTDVTSI